MRNDSVDAVVFMNSLHHVPIPHMAKALAETARVLKPGGLALIHEPEPVGGYFELTKLVDDETEEQGRGPESAPIGSRSGTCGRNVLPQSAEARALPELCRSHGRRRPDPPHPDWYGRCPAARPLPQLGEHRDDAWWFDQPIRINLLRKPSQ